MAALIEADDGEIVTVPAKAFLACNFLSDAQGKLSQSDREFWTNVATRRGKLRHQTAFTAIGVVGGVAYILDGAKRARAWRDGLSRAPQEIFVTVHQLMSVSQAASIAAAYEASQRVERSADAIKGAYNAGDMAITSPLLAHGAIGTAIYLAFRGSVFEDQNHPSGAPINLREAVPLIKDELLFLDSLNCPTRVFYAGILAMAIVALALDPNAKEFIQKIAEKRGSMIDGKMDPVASVSHLALVTELMQPGRKADYQAELFSRSLRGFDKWRNAGKKPSRVNTKGVLTAIDPQPFIKEFRTKKDIVGRVDL